MRSRGAAAAVALWTRREVRSRWRTLVALGVLAGLTAGLALAAVSGARRTSTAYSRFREATGRSDAIIFATQVGVYDPEWDEVRALPEVVDAGEFTGPPVGIAEHPEMGGFVPGDDRLFRTVNRPLLVAGRLPATGRDDEVFVNRAAADQLHLGVGDRLTVVSTAEQTEVGGPGAVPLLRATIVGVGDSNMDLVFGPDTPGFFPSWVLPARHPEALGPGNLVVRLRPGTDVTAFRRRVAEVMGVPDMPVRDQAEDTKRITNGTDLERTALLLFAGAVALAGVVLVGQALARGIYAGAESASTLRALGLTRRGLLGGLVLPLVVTAAVAAVSAVVSAIALSSRFPVGLAGRLEPDRGIHVDWPVLALGATATVLLVLLGSALAAVRATATDPGRAGAGAGRVVTRAIRARVPVPAGIGAALALERGTGQRALPVRPALAGATAGVLGIVGAFGLLEGIDDALVTPERAGQVWHAWVSPDEERSEAAIVAEVEADETVSAVARQRKIDLDVNGAGLPVYSLDPLEGGPTFVLLRGRRPVRPDDVVLGPATAKALHRGTGDAVRVGGDDGHDVRVVGLGLLPQTPHFSFDQGLWMTGEGLDTVAAGAEPQSEVAVRFAPGQDLDAAISRLARRMGGEDFVSGLAFPQDVAYLRNVRSLPKALAGFLALLGLCAMGHALVSAVRRRKHDLAVLRALGFSPAQVAGCILWQAVTVSLVALVVGTPLGLATGRWSWRWVADATPIAYVAPLPAAVILAALVLANLTAAWPARRAARLRPSEVLRTE